jgi:F0F1-type ATP synthase assembly protein I
MGLLKPDQKGEKGQAARQLALLTAIPAILAVSPLVGFFIGRWVDKMTETEPLFAIIGLIIGFAAAGVEIRVLLKKSSDPKNGNEKEN